MFLKYSKWALLWAVSIFILIVLPSSSVPRVPLLAIPHADKLVHAFLFCIQFLLTAKALLLQHDYARLANNAKPITLAFCIAYGAFLEWVQFVLTSERSADFYDILANTVGALLAWYLFLPFNKLLLVKIYGK
jgi:VanZ family protein